jgi:hypothetical protein
MHLPKRAMDLDLSVFLGLIQKKSSLIKVQIDIQLKDVVKTTFKRACVLAQGIANRQNENQVQSAAANMWRVA